ncbi:glycosyltransferase [Ectothiorhodospira marina]|uniref:Glycosyltransferase involved in cell wall bisynthesis n=1 Tax=Ectothiorhodospira marina TaxID=1396821 RepID=A0A1H7N5D2_9GAMM|nr:glycosyltransferase [Ectothiorhodospira marina]SEL18531.1 Glycosyltransferase involved in cell wall bisynthesis [Ectothiorhodospira marina]
MLKRTGLLRVAFFLVLLVFIALLAYKIYLIFFNDSLEALHSEQIERIQSHQMAEDEYGFAVIGNIRNSIGVFERQIIPHLNESDMEFMVSVGNALRGGGEDNYQALYGSLQKLNIPYLLTFGSKEYSQFGSVRFYDMLGPYFFSFSVHSDRFIFLDTTGKTPLKWQLSWLEDELEAFSREARHVFIFMAEPVLLEHRDRLSEDGELELEPVFVSKLNDLLDQYSVEAVFAGSRSMFDRQARGDTQFLMTGGGGGLVVGDGEDDHHYARVMVGQEGANIEPVFVGQRQSEIVRWLETSWFFIYSLFYVGYINFILIVCAFLLVMIRLYKALSAERQYYRDYRIDEETVVSEPLRVMMFTNNYLPFIGGVPISIDRLVRGLLRQGCQLKVLAPSYGAEARPDDVVMRIPSLLHWGSKGEFRLANPFSPSIARAVREFRPHVIHVHHPFWLGSIGLFVGRRLGIPVIYTYHTRLEHYAHYVPIPGRLFRNLIAHSLVKRFANKCEGVIVPTRSAEEYLHVLGVTAHILVKPTGVDCSAPDRVSVETVESLRRKHAADGATIFVSVSRLSQEKNIDFMLRAIHRARETCAQPFRLLIVGDGPERAQLERRIQEMDLDDHVTLVGAVAPEEMTAYYLLASAFLFASKSETQGMVILEAMAAGLPVVAVRASGIDDVLEDGVNGYKTQEDIAEWSARLLELLEDPARREAMSRRAVDFAREYEVVRISEDVADFYGRLLALQQRRLQNT